MQLLQELYFFQQHLHNLALDSLFDPQLVQGKLKAIFDWSGIQEELASWTPGGNVPLPGLSTEQLLNDLTSVAVVSDTITDWRRQIQPSLIGTISFLWGGGQNQQVVDYITQLLTVYDAPDPTGVNYFYGLQQIKTQLLEDMNFGTLAAADLIQYRALLNQMNSQINAVIVNNPTLNRRYERHATLAVDLRREFEKASPEDKEALFPILVSSSNYTKTPTAAEFPEATEEEFLEVVEQIKLF